MKERSLVAFTLLGQTAVGMFWALALVSRRVPGGATWVRGPTLVVGVLLLAAGVSAVLHLGTPRNAWRALSNVGSSWLSREVALTGLFVVGWLVVTFMRDVLPAAGPGSAAGGAAGMAPAAADLATALTALVGGALVYAMARVYRLRTVPAWDTRITPLSFYLTTLSLGAPAAALALSLATSDAILGSAEALRALVGIGIGSLIMERVVEVGWRATRETAAHQVDAGLNPRPADGSTGPWRGGSMGLALAASVLAWFAAAGDPSSSVFIVAIGLAVAGGAVGAVLGRVRFYGSYARRGL
jgi:anaerobic dimethyl sulfoxide reductase subunit C (anchor subunit)